VNITLIPSSCASFIAADTGTARSLSSSDSAYIRSIESITYYMEHKSSIILKEN
jgi:hypothetical protein